MTKLKPKTIMFVSLAVLMALSISLVFLNSNSQEPKSVLGESSQTKTESNVSVNVMSSDELEAESSFGKKIIRLGVELTNNSPDDLLVSPGLQTFLVGSNDKLYNYTAQYSNDQPVGGVVNSGDKIKFDLDYEIPESVNSKAFIFQKDATSKQVLVKLN